MKQIQRYFLLSPQLRFGSWDFEANIYSKMKHGCPASLDHFAERMAPMTQRRLTNAQNTIICSGAYKAVPNAANLLLRAILRKVHLGGNKVGRLKRTTIFPFDYAKLPFEERYQAIQNYSISFDPSPFSGKRVVIIDDALVTGAHEKKLIDALGDVAESLEFIYCINLMGILPQVEDRLNKEEIVTPMDIMLLMHQDEYILNTRALRLIMDASRDEFEIFMSCITPEWKKRLFELARAEEYDRLNQTYFKRMNDLYLKMEEATASQLYADMV